MLRYRTTITICRITFRDIFVRTIRTRTSHVNYMFIKFLSKYYKMYLPEVCSPPSPGRYRSRRFSTRQKYSGEGGLISTVLWFILLRASSIMDSKFSPDYPLQLRILFLTNFSLKRLRFRKIDMHLLSSYFGPALSKRS